MFDEVKEIFSANQETGLRRKIDLHQTLISYFKYISASIPDGMICIDKNGRIIMVNASTEKLFGYKENDLIGKTPGLFYDKEEVYENDCKFWYPENESVENQLFEANFKNKDNAVIPVEISSTYVVALDSEFLCYIALIRDISERKKFESHLRQMEITFRTVADFTYDWEIWTLPNGTFRYISPSCLRITGYSAEEFMQNPSLFTQIIHEEDQIIWKKHHDESQLGVTLLREQQYRIVCKDGKIRWIEHACQAVTGENDELLGYRSSNRDITKRKSFEEELQIALVEIERYKEQLEAESAYLQQEIKLAHNHENIIGSSNALQYILFKIEQIADSDTTVLLLGETGSGKELFARAIHNTSTYSNRPMVKINCATLPANLIESELFGHERGSFTDAHKRQIGRFELADNGTIFLDEIGEIPLALQAKLLRVLQEGEFERLGSSKTQKVKVRVIAATNRNLEEDVEKGLFRKDLWYRLNVYPITAPPLRDRDGDIQLLVRHFVERFGAKQGKDIKAIPRKVLKNLEQYQWPGNIRELENVIERAVINTQGSKLTLAENLSAKVDPSEIEFQTLEELERSYIVKVLKKTKWKVSGKNSAAEILGLKRSTLRARMEKHNIQRP